VLNSLTKPECLIYQTGLSGFGSSNSAASFVEVAVHWIMFLARRFGCWLWCMLSIAAEEGT
jgi:hypothetical protein